MNECELENTDRQIKPGRWDYLRYPSTHFRAGDLTFYWLGFTNLQFKEEKGFYIALNQWLQQYKIALGHIVPIGRFLFTRRQYSVNQTQMKLFFRNVFPI